MTSIYIKTRESVTHLVLTPLKRASTSINFRVRDLDPKTQNH